MKGYYYNRSIRELNRYLKQNKQSTKAEWDRYASENGFLGGMVLADKAKLQNWEELKKKIKWLHLRVILFAFEG